MSLLSIAPARTDLPATPARSSPHAESCAATGSETRTPTGVLRLAIAGGGTGGHLVPGLNVCLRALSRREGGRADRESVRELSDVLFLTSGRAVEEPVLAGLGEKLAGVPWERVVLALEPRGGGAPSRTALLLRT